MRVYEAMCIYKNFFPQRVNTAERAEMLTGYG